MSVSNLLSPNLKQWLNVKCASLEVKDLTVDGIDLRNVANDALSSGVSSGFEISDNGDGTVSILNGMAWLKEIDSDMADINEFDVPAIDPLSLFNDSTNYVYVDVDGGIPVIKTTTVSSAIDSNTTITLYIILRQGTELNIVKNFQYQNSVNKKLQGFLEEKYRIARVDGLGLGEAGLHNVTITSGGIWTKLNKEVFPNFDTTGTSRFDYYYLVGATWNFINDTDDYDMDVYNNPATGRVAMVAGDYSWADFYVIPDGTVIAMYGQAKYPTLSEAESAPIVSVYFRYADISIYVGRIVKKFGNATSPAILSPFSTNLDPVSSVGDHTHLSNLSVDSHSQYALLAGRPGQTLAVDAINEATPAVGVTIENTQLLDNDIIPVSDDAMTLGSATKRLKDGYFIDSNGQQFQLRGLAASQVRLREGSSLLSYTNSYTTVASVFTFTVTDASGIGVIGFYLDEKVIVHSGPTLSIDLTSFAGTDAVPKNIYVYAVNNGSDVPILEASNSYPVVSHSDVCTMKVGTVSASSTTIYAEICNGIIPTEALYDITHRFYHQGALYIDGCGQTVTAADATFATGTVMYIAKERTSAQVQVSVNGMFHSTSAGYVTQNNFTFTEYGDGTAIGGNKYYNVVLGIHVNGATEIQALVQNKPTVEYNTLIAAENDQYNTIVTYPQDSLMFKSFVPIARVIVQNGTIQDLGGSTFFYDIRQTSFGTAGGSSGGVLSHTDLTNLTSDDHLQYALLNGRSGNTLKMDDIIEFTTDHGVVIEGTLLKDSNINTSGDLAAGTISHFGSGDLIVNDAMKMTAGNYVFSEKFYDLTGLTSNIDFNGNSIEFNCAGADGTVRVNGNSTAGDAYLTISKSAAGDTGQITFSTGGVTNNYWINSLASDNDLKFFSNSALGFGIQPAATVYFPQCYARVINDRPLHINSGGEIGTVSSLMEHKTNVVDITDVDWVYQLSPKTYNYKRDTMVKVGDEWTQQWSESEAIPVTKYGFIAEEVQAVNPDACYYKDPEVKDELQGVNFDPIIAGLVKCVQDLKTRLDAITTATPVVKCLVVSSSNLVLSGLQIVDGITLKEFDYVLVAGQSDTTQNGIYQAGYAAWKKTSHVLHGIQVNVLGGVTHADSMWLCTTDPGDSNIVFAKQ